MTDLSNPAEAGGDWHHNALVGGWWEDDATLARGFVDVARAGVKDILSNGPDDALVAPIVFNYRHAFELVLKHAIRQAAWVVRKDRKVSGQPISRRLLASRLEGDLSRGDMHALGRLLDKLMYLLAEAGMEALPSETVKTIRQLHKLDESGQTFRYTMVRAREIQDEWHPARPDQIRIDMVQFAQFAERLNAAFDLIYDELLIVLLEVQVEQTMEALELRGGSQR